MGTWKLNLEPRTTIRPTSQYSPGFPAPKSETIEFALSGENGVKFTGDTVDADGKTIHVEYTAQLDGKDYPVKGDPNRDTVSLKRVKPNVTEGTSKKAGEVTGTFSILLWGNGLLMTVTSKDTRNGKTYDNIALYQKVIR